MIASYPVFGIHLSANQETSRRILLSAGTHGDEPAGPEAILRFLERNNDKLVETFDFFVLPCINPHGYVNNLRVNSEGIDINRSFEDDSSREAILIKKTLRNQRFDLFIEFHEDWELEGFYLFENHRHQRLFGPEVIDQVQQVGPIYKGSTLDDFPVSNGVVSPDLELHNVGIQAMPLYVFRFHSDHIVTSETPLGWEPEKRVAAHLTTLDTTLAALQSHLHTGHSSS